MQLGFRKVSVDLYGSEYVSLLGSKDGYLALQGPSETNEARIKRQFKSTKIFYNLAPNHILKGISLTSKDNFTTAVFNYENVGEFKAFLSMLDSHMQYANGRKLGRAIALLHQDTLTSEEKDKAEERLNTMHNKLTNYLNSGPRFNHEKPVLKAIIDRIDGLGDYKLTRRYGGLRLDNVFYTDNGKVVLKPSASYGYGDAIEDLVLFECEDAGEMPCVVAGVIDGYFGGVKIPANFWVVFAIYSAIYSLTYFSKQARKNNVDQKMLVAKSRRVLEDFDNFTRPIPRWYRSRSIKRSREIANRMGI